MLKIVISLITALVLFNFAPQISAVCPHARVICINVNNQKESCKHPKYLKVNGYYISLKYHFLARCKLHGGLNCTKLANMCNTQYPKFCNYYDCTAQVMPDQTVLLSAEQCSAICGPGGLPLGLFKTTHTKKLAKN